MLQHSGSFKARGAFANLLLRQLPAAGVVAASGGNHGAAVAYAAQRLGIPATIFVPDITSPAKAERIKSYGAKLVIVGNRYADALPQAKRISRPPARCRSPYDQAETLLGQGSVGLELEQDAPDIDTLFVPVGGGGLIGGIAAWFAGGVRIVAIEPEQSPTLHAAFAAGPPVDAPAGGLAGDSLAPPRVGQLMFPIARAHVAQASLVSDDAIRQAQAAFGACSASSPNPAPRRRLRRCCHGSIVHRRASVSPWWSRGQYDGGQFRRVGRATLPICQWRIARISGEWREGQRSQPVSRHHILPPVIYSPPPPKPKETKRKRGVGYASAAEATGEAEETRKPRTRRRRARPPPSPKTNVPSKPPSGTSLLPTAISRMPR